MSKYDNQMSFTVKGYNVQQLEKIVEQWEKAQFDWKKKMTKEEAYEKVKNSYGVILPKINIVDTKTVMKLFEHECVDGQTIRLETWKEGLVLWVNGEIVWKAF